MTLKTLPHVAAAPGLTNSARSRICRGRTMMEYGAADLEGLAMMGELQLLQRSDYCEAGLHSTTGERLSVQTA